MEQAKALLYTLRIQGTDVELGRLADLRVNIEQLGKDIKELSETDKKAAEQAKIQLKEQKKEYNDLQKSVQNRNKAEQEGVKTLESMRAKLANLNKEQERIPVGTKAFEEQRMKAKALRDEINAIDQASGKWQGNVGNYKNAIIDAFQQIGINVTAITGKVETFGSVIQMAGNSAATASGKVETFGSVIQTADNSAATASGKVETFGSVIQMAGNSAATASGKVGFMSAALRVLRIALISTGIGAVVVALGTLITYFLTTQKGIDAVNSVLKPLTTSFQRLIGIAQKFGGGLADVLSGKYKEGFEKMGAAIKGVGDEIEAGWKDGQRLAEIIKEIDAAKLKLAENEGRITREMEEQRSILDDVNRSDEERRKAAIEYSRLNNELIGYKKEIAALTSEEAEIKAKQNDTDRDAQIELARLKEEQNALTAEGFAKEREVKNKLNAIDKKAADDRLRAIVDERKEVQKLSEEYLKAAKAFVIDATTFDDLNAAIRGTGKLIDDLQKEISDLQAEVAKQDVGTEEWAALNKQLTEATKNLNTFKDSIQTLEVRDIEFDIPDGSEILDREAEFYERIKHFAVDANQEIVSSYQDRFDAIHTLLESGQITQQEADAATVIVKKEQNQQVINDASESLNQLSDLFGQYSKRREEQNEADFKAGRITERKYLAEKKSIATQTARVEATQAAFRQVVAVSETLTALTVGTAQTAKVGFPQNIPLLIGFAAQVAGLLVSLKNIAIPAVPKFARGVIGLDGAGTAMSDSIDAKLSRGESVMTARATTAFAPVLAEMERAVGNAPNVQLGSRHFAGGYIPQPAAVAGLDFNKAIREAVGNVAAIPVVVSESDITATQQKVRRIKVMGDL